MKSRLPKVLHRAGGRSLLSHVLHAAQALDPLRVVAVIGPDMEAVAREARSVIPEAAAAVQTDRRGTAHAVSMARPALAGFGGTVLILYGDVPLITAATLKSLVERVSPQMPLAVLGFEARDPTGYGRLKTGPAGEVLAIREELDATPEERSITLCNSGIIAVSLGSALGTVAADRQRQQEGRVLPHRPGGTGSQVRSGVRPVGLLRERSCGGQRPRSAGGYRRGVPAPLPSAAPAGRCHAGRARDGLFFGGYGDRPGRGHRTACRLRAGRDGG